MLAVFGRAPIERDRFAPPALVVREASEVVQHRRLTIELAELLVDLQRATRVRRLLPPAGVEQRPVEDEARMRERAVLAGGLGLGDRLAAERDRLVHPSLALAHGGKNGQRLCTARPGRPALDTVESAQPTPRPAHGGDEAPGTLGHLGVA